jgi:phage tail sheath protein FI
VFTAKVINKTADIAISRGDCFYIATPAVEFAGWTAVDAESQLVGSAGWLSTITRSWAGAAYAMYYKMKDEYNDTTVDVPAAGLIAGAYAYSDAQSAQWFAPAGPKRGIQPGVELGKIWNQGQTDVLYLGGMNWVQNTPRYGNTLEGQKTLYGANSALSRVNVARLMLKLRRDLTSFLQDFVYELNNERNRLLAYNGVDSYLREIRSREGLTDYRVVCDETNNPPSVIDQNKLNLDIYVKPPKVAEFLYLRSTIASSGVDFSTIIQQA